jgi:hypothetical protein
MYSKFIFAVWLALISWSQAAPLVFKETLKELHAPADAKSVTADFEFTNDSEQSVTVAKYDAACSCMAVTISNGKLSYGPGESGVVRATFEMGNFSGTVDKVVALWLDNDPADKPSLALTVRVHIPVLVALEPKTLTWTLDAQPATQNIRITMNHDKPIRVTAVNSSSTAFRHELKTVEEGKIYDLAITPTGTDTPGLAVVRIETDCAIERHRIQQAFAVVRKAAPAVPAAKP